MAELVVVIIAAVAAISAAISTFLSYRQLQGSSKFNRLQLTEFRDQLDLQKTSNVLALEALMLAARKDYEEALIDDTKGRTNHRTTKSVAAFERYLNTQNRFCAYIRWGVIDEERYRGDYRETFKESWMDVEADQDLNPLRFRHLGIVVKCWNDDQKALEAAQDRGNQLPASQS